MKIRQIIYKFFFAALIVVLFSSFTKKEMTGSLFINFTNLEKKDGHIEVSIYKTKKDFMKKGKSWKKRRIAVSYDGDAEAVFENIPYGTYAAVSYHDVNSNGKFDRNWVGLPKEPYAFSKAFRKKTRKPRFKEVNFEFGQPNQVIEMGFQKF